MKFTLLIIFILAMVSEYVEADNYRSPSVTNNYYQTNEKSYFENSEDSGAIALALATFHPFDFGTKQTQWSINGASYSGSNRVSIALAKRTGKALFHTSYGQNSGKDAFTFGIAGRF